MSFDFSRIGETTDRIPPNFALSSDALYEVLQGKPVAVHRQDDTIHLEQHDSELVIQCNHAGKRREYRVWLAELAVGWNMLSRTEGVQAA